MYENVKIKQLDKKEYIKTNDYYDICKVENGFQIKYVFSKTMAEKSFADEFLDLS